MDLRVNDLDEKNIVKENKNNSFKNLSDNINEENAPKQDVYFYIMTLQADGERHQIKIFENSDASELAFNFCKTYNLDFQTMKYLKKCIKQIIVNFNNTRKNEMIYLLKDNSSIQEVAEEEIITDNSLKKSGTHKKSNSNILNNEENTKSKGNDQENGSENLTDKLIDNKIDKDNTNSKFFKEEIEQKSEEKKEEISKSNNLIEDADQIEIKDYSIENDSLEIFPPTEHTTKIEQRSSIKNSSSFNMKNNKKNSKNNKLQIKNSNFNWNRLNKKQNCLFNLNKIKKENNNTNEINSNELKNILIQYKEISTKELKSKSKAKSKEKKFEIEKDKFPIKKNNYMQFNKKPKSLEKMKKKNNKSSTLDYKNKDTTKQHKNNSKIKTHEKFLSNMNMIEIKNKYFSNYYDYFIKSRNFNKTLSKNNAAYKFQTSNSINQDSNRSRSLSNHKNNNMTQKLTMRHNGKKEKSMIDLNTLNQNHHKKSSTSRFNLNTFLKKESYSKEKQKTVFKNKIKRKYSIICNSNNNNNYFNKTINGRCHTSKTKIKNINGQELFIESKKTYSNGIKKMVTESLLNIHKSKDPSKDKRKSININGKVIKALNSKNKKNKTNDLFFSNESNIESSINLYEQLYYESGTNPTNNLTIKNKRNITDINLGHKKTNFRDECKKNY